MSRSNWSDLDGWASDDHAAAFSTFLASCRALTVTKQRPTGRGSLIFDALKDVCGAAFAAIPLDDDGARKFFEDNFRPLRINRLGDKGGFLTGYYEPIIEGSRVPTGQFTAPLYRRPPNLVVSGRRKLGDAFPSKGVKVGRRVGRRKIVPYYDRGEIEDGALDGWHLEICWLHDPVDVLFAQIQGSARIRLEDGTILRVNYDSHNGWPYLPVGKVLIDRGYLTKDSVSMQSIRDWMEANPDLPKMCGGRTNLMCSSASPTSPPKMRRSAPKACRWCRAARSQSITRCMSTACRSSLTPIYRSPMRRR